MLQAKTRWIVHDTNRDKVQKLAKQLEISTLAATLLVNRGFDSPEEASIFLHMEDNQFHDPFLMPDMEKAVERIKRAVNNKEPILVFGDYDADGVTSTSLLTTVLQEMGAVVDFYIPNRFTEGYGPNEAAFRKAFDEGVQLIITVDTGISAIHEALVAKELGIDLIITDHHELRDEIPEAHAIIHPKLKEDAYPFPYLAGVGVAFKLAHALYGKVPYDLLDLVAIGTVCDLVPLIGENRLIVKKGLQILSSTKRPGLLALGKTAGIQFADLSEETLGFTIGPRLNAAGRLDSAVPAANLLMAKHADEAALLADEIEILNKERQTLVSEMTKEAVDMISMSYPLSENKVLVIGKEGWNAGVIGIVASRITEQFYRPAIVLSYDSHTGQAKGSARSIPGFDLFANLLECADILPHFGGHPMAAGMTLDIKDVDELRKRLNRAANNQLSAKDFVPVTELEASISLDDITLDTIKEVERLAPFGVANPKPAFMVKNAAVNHVRKIGGNDAHLKLTLSQNDMLLDGVGFHLGKLADDISPDAKLSVIGELSINEWNNRRKPQIFIRDMAINEWQLFDFRGNKPFKTWVPLLHGKDAEFIVFHEKTLSRVPELRNVRTVLIPSEERAQEYRMDGKNVVLVDFPFETAIIEGLVKGKKPDRIYVHFFHEREHFFHTIPTRDHFKWYYAFLAKRRTFNVKKYGEDLAAYRGWSKETVQFMTQVFFELDFVKIDEGIISLKQAKMKKDLADSPSFQKKQEMIKLENILLYSSYPELKKWFEERVAHSIPHEEEVEAWT
ncbi:single-stranded-DNA-specific exonuclease [Bacillus thermophilus]|uniref:Single-stranded-DNA-specific exonuclease RecJ n=1 Tax=Siminovitchia thermophila TaxID=1245522 RepID=A0ABS2RAA0_9BACI|nr:single-stranded-DNA-specific exonuclease RecJ [Siminovitchia thermophila]MBM7716519.1 single-stranded-DNA-specific exonuclease [Siminovitchia thermophila]ONK24140.1 single-stranded-DNA-specific exonuclease RecJ [Bacillus sp. VT-16-64]